MLDPCANLRVASRIFVEAYVRATATFPSPRQALWAAISAYNTGSLYAGAAYVNRVVAAASHAPLVPTIEFLPHETMPEPASVVIHVIPRRVVARRVVPLADFSVGTPDAHGLVIGISAPPYAKNGRAR